MPKKNNDWWITGNCRKLNSRTVPDRYPIPLIEDILQQLHGKQIFSTIDLTTAYHQIPVATLDVEKTAIATPFGLFEFVVMPPGLRNATQTFQRHMENIFRDLPFIAVYIDDLIVMSVSLEEHIVHFEAVFQKLHAHRLVINMDKCDFAKKELTYLGFRVTPAGFSPPSSRIEAIVSFKKPNTIAELR